MTVRRRRTSSVPDGQVVSSLEQDVQLVHAGAGDGRLRRLS